MRQALKVADPRGSWDTRPVGRVNAGGRDRRKPSTAVAGRKPLFCTMFVDRPELVPAGSERSTRGVFQRSDREFRLKTGIDQVFRQRAEDAVVASIDLDNLVRVPARCLQDTAGRGVDHRANSAGLGIKRVSTRHDSLLQLNPFRTSGAPISAVIDEFGVIDNVMLNWLPPFLLALSGAAASRASLSIAAAVRRGPPEPAPALPL